MLNFIYYPVSWIMLVWHWLFDKITPNTPNGNGIAWALSVVFLVFTLRAILYKPFVKQIQTTKKMQEIQPQMQAIRKKYGKDQVKMAEEMQKLQREHGFNPLLGCLPMFMQIPVFIGLFHVLRAFNRTVTTGAIPIIGHPTAPMTVEQNRNTPNYGFSKELVQNFLEARFFGVPLSSFFAPYKQGQWDAFMHEGHGPYDFTRTDILLVILPIMIIASLMTYLNARAAVKRQTPAMAEAQQTRIMNMLSQYIFPLGILVSGPFFPVAILLYWVSNNVWTFGQQHLVFGRMAREEEEAKKKKEEANKANAPKPGARPDRTKRGAADAAAVEGDSEKNSDADSASSAGDDSSTAGSGQGRKSGGSSSGGAGNKGGTTNKGKAAGSKKNRQAARKNKGR